MRIIKMKANIIKARKTKFLFITKTLFALGCFTLLCIQAVADQSKSAGNLFGMGNNSDGQLAATFSYNTNMPFEMIPTNNVIAVAAGYYHSLWLENDGSLWGVGAEGNGQLGNGTYGGGSVGTSVPVEITNGVVAISAGSDFSLFLKNDGSLWGMGDEESGQLGDGTYGSYPNYSTNLPVQITNGVTAISAGFAHSLFIKSDGSLWAMGDNSYGELGTGNQNPANVPVEIEPGNVTAIAAGQYFSLFVKSDGSLWGMGDNPVGNLGDGTNRNTFSPVEITNGVTAVSAGGIFSLFIKSDGTLWGMGNNDNGQLGDGTTSDTYLPVQITNGVIAIAAGDYDSLFIKSDGSLWDMGNNQSGQLGDGNFGGTLGYTNLPEEIETNGVIAISAGYDHNLFVKGPPAGFNKITVDLVSGGKVERLASALPRRITRWTFAGCPRPSGCRS